MASHPKKPETKVLIRGQIQTGAGRMTFTHFGDFAPADSWSPAVNLYRLANRIEVCVDVAGVDPASVRIVVEPGRMIIRGSRTSPEPLRQEHEPLRIIAMEIDHGSFSRVLSMPDEADLLRTQTRYADGLLWVHVPLREPC